MTITVPAEPAGGRELVAAELVKRSHRAKDKLALRGTPSTTAPLPLYALTGDDLARADPLTGAEQVGWRYLLVGGEELGFVMVSTSKDQLEYAGFASGGLSSRLFDAILLADQQVGGQPEHYEIRLLNIPSRRELTVWLSGVSSLFIPVRSGHTASSAALVVQPSTDFLGRMRRRSAN